jgi:hypothetical protein
MARQRIADDEIRVRCYLRTNGDGSGARASLYITGGLAVASALDGSRVHLRAEGSRTILLRRSEDGVAVQRDPGSGRMFLIASARKLVQEGLVLDGLDAMVTCPWEGVDDGIVIRLPTIAREAHTETRIVHDAAARRGGARDPLERIAASLDRIASTIERMAELMKAGARESH